ncbi:MAG: sortase [Patescibacteria group bacterium]
MSHLKNATPIHHHIKKQKRREYFKVLILRTIGNFLILSSLFMIGKTFYQPVSQEVRYFIERQAKKEYVVASDKKEEAFHLQKSNQPKGALSSLLNVKSVEVLVPEDAEFSVVIPKIGANARVIAGVDASDEKAYLEALKKGVAHAAGTAFPGEGGHVFLFAHSTDYFWNVGTYNAIFYLLHKLEIQDEINIFHKGQRYVYRVVEKTVVDPSQVEYLTRKTDKEFITLQTCWPPGTTLKRLLIFAVRVAD